MAFDRLIWSRRFTFAGQSRGSGAFVDYRTGTVGGRSTAEGGTKCRSGSGRQIAPQAAKRGQGRRVIRPGHRRKKNLLRCLAWSDGLFVLRLMGVRR